MIKLLFQESKWLKKLPWFIAGTVLLVACLALVMKAVFALSLGWALQPTLGDVAFVLQLGLPIGVIAWAGTFFMVWAVVDSRRVDHMAVQLWLWAADRFVKIAQDMRDTLFNENKEWPDAQIWMLHRFVKLMFVLRPDPHWRYAPMQKTRFELVSEFCQSFSDRGDTLPKYEVTFSGMQEGQFTNGGLWINVKETYTKDGELKEETHRYYEDPYNNKTS